MGRMTVFVTICVLAACLLGGLAWKRHKASSVHLPAEKVTRANRKNFKSIEICPGPVCCKAAVDHAGKRLLLERSPRLPLDKCDRIRDCNCTFINHSDRRASDDRRNPYGSLSTSGAIGMRDANQRAGMDRRSSSNTDSEDQRNRD
jgi:hypothetical protein